MSPGPHAARAGRSERGAVLARLLLVAVAVLCIVAVVVVVTTTSTSRNDLAQEPSTATGTGIELATPAKPSDVLAAASGRGVAPQQVRRALAGLLSGRSVGAHLAVQVEALGATRPLLVSGRPLIVTPASTTKLLTTATALDVLGPQHRFATTAVTGPTPHSVVLVGGGDPVLTDRPPPRGTSAYPEPATLQALARQTARQLEKRGVRRITLGFDDSLFQGPAVNPHWPPAYVKESIVSPITALWVDEGRVKPQYAARAADPSAAAARRFAALLVQAGIAVNGPIDRMRVRPDAKQLGEVESAPLAQIVQHVLEFSDNEGAEVLLRQAALGAGKPATFQAGVATVRRTLTSLGVDVTADRWYDGSGLSRQDRISVSTLVAVLQLAASSDHPDLRPVVSTLPVAGFTGSLAYRFVADAPAGLGVVRAKTGTLTGVHGLAGIVVNREGAAMMFAAVADRVPVKQTLAARARLDQIAAALAAT